MIDGLGMHRAHDAQVVHDFCRVREQIAHPGSALALLAELENGAGQRELRLIAGHAGPQTMIAIADQGKGRFYDVRSPDQLPQIFIKEAAVILKSAIFEEPFKPQQVANSEVLRGIIARGLGMR